MAKNKSEFMSQRREQWRRRLARWQTSELSQAEFCRQEQVPVWQFVWWKKRLALTEWPAAKRNGRRGGRRAASATAFVPVRLVGAAGTAGRLEVVLVNRRRLRFPVQTDLTRLTEIVTALETATSGSAEDSPC